MTNRDISIGIGAGLLAIVALILVLGIETFVTGVVAITGAVALLGGIAWLASKRGG
jgi:hypothetical protein